MQRLVRKLTILGLLIGALIFLAAPQPTRADECGLDAISEASDCAYQFSICIGSGGSLQQCSSLYSGCLNAATNHHAACTGNPQPLPVNDDSLSICITTCNELCGPIENFAERTACYSPCSDYCRETFPKP
jgi:hypothetical protein